MSDGARAVAALAICGACGGGSSSRAPAAPPVPIDAAGAMAEPVRCGALDGPELATATFPGGWTTHGRTLSRDASAPPAAGTVAIGVIADSGGAAPVTLAALGRLRAQLDAAHVDVVVSLGGMGATEPEIEASLGALATGAAWPVVALPGDLEPVAAHDAAITALRAKQIAIVDGRTARWIELPGATIATLPGAGAAERLAAGVDGCGYRAADVDAIVAALADKHGVRILAASEAPRGRARDGDATGDLALAAAGKLDLVVHAASDEADPATDSSHATVASPSPSPPSLSPGPSDATPRLPGPRHPATAGVVAISAGHWTWRVLVDAP